MADFRLARSTEALLDGIVAQAKDGIGKCDSAGLTLLDAGQVTGGAFTDRVASDLGAAQVEAGEGPCVDALRFLQIFNVGSIGNSEEWPAFRRLAVANGIRSSLSVPLAWGKRTLGTISLYSRAPHAFEDCERLAMTFASHAAAALAHDKTLAMRTRPVG